MLNFSLEKQAANIITFTRVAGVVFIFWLTPYKTNYWQIITVSIFIVVSVTDFLDGWVARKFNIVSNFGKMFDPVADKILVLVFLPLLEMQVISSFPVFIILAREYAIMGVRIMTAKEGTIIGAKLSGKIKTAITLPVCGILFARVPVVEVANLPLIFVPFNFLRRWIISWPNITFTILIWSTVAITIWSFLDYFSDYIWQQFVKKAGNEEVKAKKILRSLIPNTFSMLNLICGTFAAVLAAFGYYHTAVLLVLLGTLFDAFDGPLARKLDASSKFGARLDSSADFVSFGIAPAIIVYRVFYTQTNSIFLLFWGVLLSIVYYISVQYRLKRFDQSGHSNYFEGLPSPVGAGLVLIAAISIHLHDLYFFVPIVIISSLLMISRINYPHLTMLTKRKFFKLLTILAFLFIILTIINLFNTPYLQKVFVYEILFGIAGIYLFSPFFIIKK